MTKEKTIKQIILQLTGKQSYKGFSYVIYGISLTIDDRKRLQFISKSLYIDIAAKFNTSWQNVERDIRTVIDVIWRNKNNELLKKICKGKVTDKPNNKDFFILMSEYINYIEENDEIAASSDVQFNEEFKVFKEYMNPVYNNFIEKIDEQIVVQEKQIKLLNDIYNLLHGLVKNY